jgi:phosphatidylserine/phosphatidylglycerophosphate/cardiolipin synthase-like enzyme
MDDIDVSFLCQYCQSSEDVAKRLAAFIARATRTLDMSIYSFSLCPESRDIVLQALQERARAGVRIRIAYDADTQHDEIEMQGNDVCDHNTPHFVAELGFPSKAIEGYRALMHNKYVVIDAGTPNAQVWTGSANFTDDSWTLQENNLLVLRSPELAAYFAHDFEELWVDGNVVSSDAMDSGEVVLSYKGQPARVQVDFAPVEGEWIDDNLAGLVAGTRERLTLAFVVLTSGDIIEAVQRVMERGIPIEGVYDWSQMEGVKHQWSLVPSNNWKIGAFEEIVRYGNLVGKHSTPYTPTSVHDFMHNKVMVVDDTVVTGSYNFSRHAQQNAENVLVIESAPLASVYRKYIADMMRKYTLDPSPTTPGTPTPPASQAPPAPST